jgi:hypothetical protein
VAREIRDENSPGAETRRSRRGLRESPNAAGGHVPLSPEKFLGVVEVDSGTLVIGDPAYLLPHAARGKGGVDYEVVIETRDPITRLGGQPVLLLQHFGGDGTFPVFGQYEDGELIRVTIDLVELGG